MSIVLIGPPAAGKTRVGKRLARALGRAFIDTDKEIVAEHGAIREIFAEHGEAWFRRVEREHVRRALGTRAVVSLGGGAVLDEDTRADLAGHIVVMLTTTPEAVEDRIGNAKRPLIRDLEDWKAIERSRRALYESLADHIEDTSTRPVDRIAEDLAAWVREKT